VLANSDNDETGAAAPGVACVSPTPRQHSTRCAAPARCRPPRGRGAQARVVRAVRAWLAARRLRTEHALALPQPAVCGFPAAKCWPMSNGLYILHTCTLLHVNTRGATALTRDPCTTRREFLRSLPGIYIAKKRLHSRTQKTEKCEMEYEVRIATRSYGSADPPEEGWPRLLSTALSTHRCPPPV
jgi:hypothetical protein